MNKKPFPWGLCTAVALVTALSWDVQADTSNTIEYTGRLIALPCTVDPIYENFGIDFGGNINAKDLVSGERRYSKEDITFQLTDCDTSLGNTISAKFSGASTTPAGLLNVDAGSEASGIVVGLETPSGVALPINNAQVEPVMPITQGNMTIRLRSYVQAAEGATMDTIVPGFFTATLTYSLVYQ
ncbi:fimbrial protein [Providencia rettgeri]|uniref:Fimbrial protein n=1 Tax=Providencia stuartii TaxID=588 RepID=A0AAI9DF26_PROST|nr:fimbrial protein [Providencia stuartii]MDV5227254.1 fimbrial protein [Providencia rettgeri]